MPWLSSWSRPGPCTTSPAQQSHRYEVCRLERILEDAVLMVLGALRMIKRFLAISCGLALCPAAGSGPTPPPPVEVPLTSVVEPLTDLVGQGESDTVGGYDAANNGYPFDLGKHGVRKVFGRPAAEVTVGEIRQAQDQRRVHAVGRYQIIGVTLRGLVRSGCLDDTQHFTQETQDEAFLCLIQENRPSVWGYIKTGQGIVTAANAMSREWSSMPYRDGSSYYGGWDAAKATRSELFDALEASRANYVGRLGDHGGLA